MPNKIKEKVSTNKGKEMTGKNNASQNANEPEALLQHDYSREEDMEIKNAGNDKRHFGEMEDTQDNLLKDTSPARKWVRPNEELLGPAILEAINTLASRFDKQEKQLEVINVQIRENSVTIGNLAKALEFNAAELKECKGKVSTLEKKVVALQKENADLKERTGEYERYSRRWNLRIKGIKETMNENTREEVITLLKKVAPHWAQKMEEIVDTTHRIGKKEEKRTRQVIVQFVKRQHRDGIWRMTKESETCKELGIRFIEDLTREDKQAREALWPQIQEARKAGKKAYFRGPYGFINGQKI